MPAKTPTLTAAMLRTTRPCRAGMARFRRLFPKGCPLTKANALRAMNGLGFDDVQWATQLLSEQAKKRHRVVRWRLHQDRSVLDGNDIRSMSLERFWSSEQRAIRDERYREVERAVVLDLLPRLRRVVRRLERQRGVSK